MREKFTYKIIRFFIVTRGLSDTVTVMIILIASVAAVLSVVVVAFALLGANSKFEEVYAVGNGKIEDGKLYVLIRSNVNVSIISLSINDGTVIYSSPQNVPLHPGINNVTLTLPSDFKPRNYTVYSITLTLSNGHTVLVSATA